MEAHPDIVRGAPVSDPAGVDFHPQTRRIGDRRSAMAVELGTASRCALLMAQFEIRFQFVLKVRYDAVAWKKIMISDLVLAW